MGFDKFLDIAVPVFIVVPYSGGQLVKVHVLPQIAGIVAVYHNRGGVFLPDFFKAAYVMGIEVVVQFQIEIISVPRTPLFPERHPDNPCPQLVLIVLYNVAQACHA